MPLAFLQRSFDDPEGAFLVENLKIVRYKGNGVMGQAGNNFVIRNNIIDDTGVYGIFPQLGVNGLIINNVVSNIADAAIYVGMSDNVDVIGNEVFDSVAGIEIENSRHALVEGNYVYDNTGGILAFITPGLPIKTCGDVIIRNNFVAAGDADLFSSASGFDSGISLWGADGAEVYHNTVASTQAPSASSIEWRFSNTLAEIGNNMVTSVLKSRNGGVANLAGNLENVSLVWFEDVPAADLHLTTQAAGAVDQGVLLPAGLADTDIDLQLRDTTPDVGADEYLSHIFADGFESGSDSLWSGTVP